MALIETGHHFRHCIALVGQADADRTAVDARALVVDETEIDQLLQVIGHVRAEIITARAQFTGGQFSIADIEEQQCLNGIDVGTAVAVEFILDHVKQTAVQTLDQLEGFHVERADGVTTFIDNVGGLRHGTRIDHCLCLSFVAW